MKKIRTTLVVSICTMNLISGIAFGADSNDDPFLRERAKEIAQMETEQPQVDDGDSNSNPFASSVLTLICGTKSSSRSQTKIKVDNSGRVHGLKTASGTQVAVKIRGFTNTAAIVNISMKNENSGQSISISPLLVSADEMSAGGQKANIGVIEMNDEMCTLFYSK